MLEIMRENASGWIVKILFAIIIIVFVFAFGMSGFDAGQDPVLATVNDQIITRAEFEDAFQRAAENLRKANPSVTSAQLQDPQFKQIVLGELINARLLLEEASRLGISASDEEVFAAITRQSIFWNEKEQFDRNIYQMVLRSIRMTPTQFEANFKNEIIGNKVKAMVSAAGEATPTQARQIYDWVGENVTIDYILSSPAEFLDKVTVNEAETIDFYEKNAKRFMVPEQVKLRYLSFTPSDLATYQTVTDQEIEAYFAANQDSMKQEEQVKARHILVLSKENDPESVQKEAKAKIERILKKAKAGKDFAELAKTYSEGPSKVTGGDLGWFGRGAMVPEFEKAAFAAKKGVVTEAIKTQFGWHIILVEDRKEAKAKTLEEVSKDIAEAIAQEKAAERASDLLDQAMDRLVSGMTLDQVADELGLLAVTSSPLTEQVLPQAFGMTPEAAKVVMAIPLGEAHDTPLAIKDGFMLIEKVEDIPSAPLPIEKVQASIIQAIKVEKATALAQEEAKDLMTQLTGPNGAQAVKKFADRIKHSEPFGRQGNIPHLGPNPALAKAVFDSKVPMWQAETFTVPAGIVVVRLNKRIPAPQDIWEQQKDAWINQASKGYEQEMLTAYMTQLRDSAQIEIVRPDWLN